MGAGRVDELVFLGQIGVRGQVRVTLLRLGQALAQHGLELEDLLRLRMFVVDLAAQAEIEDTLEQLLSRDCWPAITIVELSAGARDERTAFSLDAIAAPAAHLTRRQIGQREDSPLGLHRSPAAVRYGPWVFVGAVIGASSRIAARTQRIEAQARNLFAHMEQLLRAAGAGLGDVIDVGGWLTFPMSEYEPLGKARNQLLAQHRLLPASSAVQVARVAGDCESLLSFEAIAFAQQDEAISNGPANAVRSSSLTEHRKPVFPASDLARPSPLAAYYATARCAGGYVFTCGEIPRTGTGICSIDQVVDVYEQLTSHLREYGASMSDVAHQTVFVRNRKDIPVVQAAVGSICASPLPTTLIPAADMGFLPGVDVEIKLIAKLAE